MKQLCSQESGRCCFCLNIGYLWYEVRKCGPRPERFSNFLASLQKWRSRVSRTFLVRLGSGLGSGLGLGFGLRPHVDLARKFETEFKYE